MLLELRIENLLLIERAELRPGGGLAVITGETGAGKTVLAHALDLLMGGKPRGGIVRPGAREAYVEGVFEPTAELLADPALAELLDRIGPDLDEIVLARRVGADGRTRALVQGRAASVADLRALGGRLIAFFGQHEHRRLTLASAQLELLDGFGGAAHRELRDGLAAAHRRVRELGAALEELQGARGQPRPRARPAALRARGDRVGRAERERGGRPAGRARAAAAPRRARGRRRRGRRGDRARERRVRRGGAPRGGRAARRLRRGRGPARSTSSPAGSPRSGSRPTTSGPSCAATPRPWRASPGASRSWRRGSSSTTG